jgi:hypothetical protein
MTCRCCLCPRRFAVQSDEMRVMTICTLIWIVEVSKIEDEAKQKNL